MSHFALKSFDVVAVKYFVLAVSLTNPLWRTQLAWFSVPKRIHIIRRALVFVAYLIHALERIKDGKQ